ncbi:MarR family winged helix-turn-helix transcriptional regulator [Embleya sp. NBC_00896]|uniref:MarR family winged helix-turn-helix transcriptional regulator n=1 Tax=Embleya sp. NBC_00896 TaxID=2975961 RepID=UPI003868FF05|nr:MarR family transcriptional regulator [Embleya sp. NBC_00896]
MSSPESTSAPIGELFMRLAKRIRVRAGRELAPLGLTPAQAHAIKVLSHAEAPLRMAELAARLEIVPRSATTVVDDLVARDLVRRSTCDRDRRATLVELTESGRTELRRIREIRQGAGAAVFDRLGEADRAELLRLLRLLDEDCDEHSCPRGSRA